MNTVRTYLCLICLIAFAHSIQAQSNAPTNSDLLKIKIAELESIDTSVLSAAVKNDHQRSLLLLYDKYVTALQRDIDALTKIQGAVGTESDPQRVKNIERLVEEQTAASTKLKTLRGDPTEPIATPSHIPRSCDEFFKNNQGFLPVGAIWCSRTSEMSVVELAELSAPILWFSPDEPLRRSGRLIPENLPGHDFKPPVVYYRISEVTLAADSNDPVTDKTETLNLTRTRGLTLRYYFYYSKDIGFEKHEHDLESIRLDIHVTDKNGLDPKIQTSLPADFYVVSINRIIGAAHGVTWYYNQLDTQSDTSLPITILVEEGKHASSPDRNGDGHYSPGYDVNRRFNDAWGVRDLIGSGELGNVGYDGSMTKPRNPADMLRVDPTQVDVETLLSSYKGPHRSILISRDQATYKLQRIHPKISTFLTSANNPNEVASARETREEQSKNPAQAALQAVGDVNKIKKFMEREKFSDPNSHVTHGDNFFQRAFKKGLGIERGDETLDALTIGLRYDEGFGFSISPPFGRYRLGVFGGYVVPKFNLVHTQQGNRFSAESLYTPSAARRVDWYASLGSEWSRRETEYKLHFVSEAGAKFRFNLGKFLMGARVGLRTSGLKQGDRPRLILELGPGAF